MTFEKTYFLSMFNTKWDRGFFVGVKSETLVTQLRAS